MTFGPMEENAEHLREQAARCRRLAADTLDDEMAYRLKAMADEFESAALDAERRRPTDGGRPNPTSPAGDD
jgi:hypothetical protein